MLFPNPLPCQFPGKQAHLKRLEQPLFSCHGPLDLESDSLRRRAGIGDGHGQDVITCVEGS